MIDPLSITKEDLPLVVLSDNLRGIFGFLIRRHTSGNYSHSMIMVHPGKVVTQGLTYKEVSIKKYMSSKYRLKFWAVKNMTFLKKNEIAREVLKDLRQPWWRKRYDFLGILGQALRIPFLNNPFRYYCSERVAKYIRLIGMVIFPHPNPAQLNGIFKRSDRMFVLGHWWKD